MYIQTLRLAIIAAAFMFTTPAMAQSGLFGKLASSGYGLTGPENCGRGITQQQAEGLWGGYCNESCAYPGGGSAGGCGSRNLAGGCGSGGCDSGSFGYPAGGCGCGGGGGKHGGCGCKLKGKHGGCGGSGGCGGCKLKGKHGGCGGCKLFGGCKKFSSSAQQCGTSGAYFEEAVGFEYGTSGIQSCVSCNSCGSFDSLAAGIAAPAFIPAPGAQSQSVIGAGINTVPFPSTPMYGAPVMSEPIVGVIESLN